MSTRVTDAFEKLNDDGFIFDDGFGFDCATAAGNFNSTTLWQVFGLAQILEREQPVTVRGSMYRGIPQLFKDSAGSG
jgi:hypothetical protein